MLSDNQPYALGQVKVQLAAFHLGAPMQSRTSKPHQEDQYQMLTTPGVEHMFDFGFGERYAHQVIPYTQIEQDAPAQSGLYSWHLRLPRQNPERAATFLNSLFHAAELNATITATMRQSWQGNLRSQSDPFQAGFSPALRDAFFAIAYPLYIGMGVHLRNRLITHKRQLEIYKDQPITELPTTAEADSDEESRCFGERLGAVFRKARFYETELLFVKCILWPSEDPGQSEKSQVRDELRSAEWVCNTLFHPVFGRR